MAGECLRKVAIWLLDQQAIAKIENIAVKGELVSITRFAQQQSRLANEVESKVGKADIDLERRPVATPFTEALTKNERIVTKVQKIGRTLEFERVALRGTHHQMCFTSSGMS